MGTPAWITISFGFQIGVMFSIRRYNSGLDIMINIPFTCIMVNTYSVGDCKKDFIEVYRWGD